MKIAVYWSPKKNYSGLPKDLLSENELRNLDINGLMVDTHENFAFTHEIWKYDFKIGHFVRLR